MNKSKKEEIAAISAAKSAASVAVVAEMAAVANKVVELQDVIKDTVDKRTATAAEAAVTAAEMAAAADNVAKLLKVQEKERAETPEQIEFQTKFDELATAIEGTIMSQAQNAAQAEVQTNKAVSTAKEEPSMLAKAGSFLSENKWKITAAVGVTAAAAAAFVYREEIGNFIGGKVSGESAGGDAFM